MFHTCVRALANSGRLVTIGTALFQIVNHITKGSKEDHHIKQVF